MGIELSIGLESWIIQDGNYSDFETNQHYSFAIEFYPHSLKTGGNQKKFESIGKSEYELNAEIVHLDQDSWVIDFGLLAYQSSKPPKGYKAGDMISGVFYIGIDHYMYFEFLKKRKNYPKLTYEWIVKKIVMDTTPFIETKPKVFERDLSRQASKSISKTDAWNDTNGSASYTLHCAYKNS